MDEDFKCHKCHSGERFSAFIVYLLPMTQTDTVRHNINEEARTVQEQWRPLNRRLNTWE